jgi:glutamate-5-semialdehyde dehydrogenase
MKEIRTQVEVHAKAASAVASSLANARATQLENVLTTMAARLQTESDIIVTANGRDVAAAHGSLPEAMLDRLRLDSAKVGAIAEEISNLASLPWIERVGWRRTLDSGLELEERRVPIGVVGANYEARGNVTVDIASQLIKSRNAGVLRTGGAALHTAQAMVDRVIRPALECADIEPDVIQLVRSRDRRAARALVMLPRLMPLVILRGSGEITAELARLAAEHGVRTLAHAEGGGVLYVHSSSDREKALRLIEASLDRLGVCNRLNLLLVDQAIWDEFLPAAVEVLEGLGIRASIPPHDHSLGHEWANDLDHAATVTIAPATSPREAAAIANRDTSGLAAAVVSEEKESALAFLDEYRGTGAFWNASTRLLDGFRLLGAPETGINVDKVPGPRGPVTYRDLYLRQYVVTPADPRREGRGKIA